HISNLSKRYGNNWVLRDISLDVKKGTVLGLIGDGASGKSTLLKLLAGREHPVPASVASELKNRQITFCEARQPAKWYELFRSRPDDRGSVLHALDRSIDSAHDILLLDDPLAGIDRESRDNYLKRISRVAAERQLTVIYATSDFETAAI